MESAVNLKLKAKIVEKYGTQADFAPVINTDEVRMTAGNNIDNSPKIFYHLLGAV